jgi:large subunit ribosomal protein L29
MPLRNRATELRYLGSDELTDELKQAKEELFNLRFQAATGQLQNHGRLKEVRKDIARIYTLMRERELGIEPQSTPARRANRGIPVKHKKRRLRVPQTSAADAGQATDTAATGSASTTAPFPKCSTLLTLNKDHVLVGSAVEIDFHLQIPKNHPWCDDFTLGSLWIFASTQSPSEVTPEVQAYPLSSPPVPAKFSFSAREEGAHPLQFTIFDAQFGVALHQVETILHVDRGA